MEFIPVLLAVVEKGAAAFGLQKRELGQMILGTEEIFNYLCSLSMRHEKLRAVLADGAYYIRLSLTLADLEVPWEAFNLSAPVMEGNENDLGELGLMLAARFLDGLEVERHAQSGIVLNLIKNKVYPTIEAPGRTLVRLDGPLRIKRADADGVKRLCGLILDNYRPALTPAFGRTPGRLVDMLASGDYQAALAWDHNGELAGGLVWHPVSEALVEFFGPFTVPADANAANPANPADPANAASLLVEYCLAGLARTSAVALFNRNSSPDFPAEYFEEMGRRQQSEPGGTKFESLSVFRLLREDNGSSSWIAPILLPFVEERCRRLNLPRRLNRVENLGERVAGHSAFLSRLDWQSRSAVMRPLQTGQDAEQVIAAYRQVLVSNGFDEIQFELDLGQAEHAELGPALLAAGFEPVHLLPYGAKGDLLVFYCQAPASRS